MGSSVKLQMKAVLVIVALSICAVLFVPLLIVVVFKVTDIAAEMILGW